MSNPFIFFDSLRGQPKKGCSNLPGLFCAIENLNEAAREGKIQLLSVSGRRRAYAPDLPEIITYEVTGRSWKNIKTSEIVTGAVFHVSHDRCGKL